MAALKTKPKKSPPQPELFSGAKTTTEKLMHGAGVAPIDQAPPQILGVSPKILNDDDLKNAVHWIAWLRSRESTVKERTKQAKAVIDQTATKDLTIDVDGTEMTIPDYIVKLYKAVLIYARENRDQLFGEKKTASLPHGSLAFAYKPESVAFEGDEAALVDRLIGELRLRKQLAELQAAFDKHPFLRITVGLNRDGIKNAVAAGTLTLANLEKRGIRLDRDEDFKVRT